ncbi:hypothetical protein SCLCIDRAFT_1211323, partial [Scleroderma citrinum Foug A]
MALKLLNKGCSSNQLVYKATADANLFNFDLSSQTVTHLMKLTVRKFSNPKCEPAAILVNDFLKFSATTDLEDIMRTC